MQQFAVLSYKPVSVDKIQLSYPLRRFPEFSAKFPNDDESFVSLNHPNTTCGEGDKNNLCITDLTSYTTEPEITDVEPDERFFLGFNNYLQAVDDIFNENQYGHFMSKITVAFLSLSDY